MIPKPPNLFHFATSELSQDAFIAWLISWADPKYSAVNNALHLTAIELLDALFGKIQHSKPKSYDSVKVDLQFRHIDVLVTINDSIPLIIEDKTFTSDHSDQLSKYVKVAQVKFPEFAQKPVPAIYFKIADQSNYESAYKAGYKDFCRSDFLKVLESGIERGVTSDVFRDYLAHLWRLDQEVESFKTIPVKDWKSPWNGWVGFFKLLQKEMKTGEWGYVPNVKGGFMGFWWYRGEEDHRYLQLEEKRLCFKIEVQEQDLQRSEWEKWNAQLTRAPNVPDIGLIRPRRSNGRWMTVAVVENYLQEDSTGLLDTKATIALLKTAEEVMNAAGALP